MYTASRLSALACAHNMIICHAPVTHSALHVCDQAMCERHEDKTNGEDVNPPLAALEQQDSPPDSLWPGGSSARVGDDHRDHSTGLLSLPPEVLHEIAVWAPLASFRHVVRFDVERIACVRLQRWYRRIASCQRQDRVQLIVGDRVLLRSFGSGKPRRGVEYATAAAEVMHGNRWKVRLLDDVYVTVPALRIRRLAEWADGPWASTVGKSVALASASRARSAAVQAVAMATQAMRDGAPTSQTVLAIAAATTASTAAAAATAASSAASSIAANTRANALEANELLEAAQLVQEAIQDVEMGGVLRRSAADVCADVGGGPTHLAQAASAAAEAAREASAATSAAMAVESVVSLEGPGGRGPGARVGSLEVTALTASRVTTAAQQVVSAVAALEGAPLSAAGRAVEVATDAMEDVGAAGHALTTVLGQAGHSTYGDRSASSPREHALDAAQAAAQLLCASIMPSEVASLLGHLPLGTAFPSKLGRCIEPQEGLRVPSKLREAEGLCVQVGPHVPLPERDAVRTNSGALGLPPALLLTVGRLATSRRRQLLTVPLNVHHLWLLVPIVCMLMWHCSVCGPWVDLGLCGMASEGAAAVGRRLGMASRVQVSRVQVNRVQPNRVQAYRVQAECSALPRMIVYNTWHKGGTVLASSIFKTVVQSCPREAQAIYLDSQLQDSSLCDVVHHSAARERAQNSSVFHLNSASYFKLHVPIACITALPPAHARFVHFIRNPFAMVASFFLYHLTGQECGYEDMQLVCRSLYRGRQSLSMGRGHKNASLMTPALVNALEQAADKLLISPLPQMVELHVATRSSPHALSLQLESFDHAFDETVGQLLRFLHVLPSLGLHQELACALRKHDVGRWTQAQRASSDHVQPGLRLGLRHDEVRQSLRDHDPRTIQLLNLSSILGYPSFRLQSRGRRLESAPAPPTATVATSSIAPTAHGARAMPLVAQWLRSARNGFCNHTVTGSVHSCRSSGRGSFGLSALSARSLDPNPGPWTLTLDLALTLTLTPTPTLTLTLTLTLSP